MSKLSMRILSQDFRNQNTTDENETLAVEQEIKISASIGAILHHFKNCTSQATIWKPLPRSRRGATTKTITIFTVICLLINMQSVHSHTTQSLQRTNMIQKQYLKDNNILFSKSFNDIFCARCRQLAVQYKQEWTLASPNDPHGIIAGQKTVCERRLILKCFKLLHLLSKREERQSSSIILSKLSSEFNDVKKLSRSKRGVHRFHQLYCHSNGRLLRMKPNGHVEGTYDHSDPLTHFEFQSVATSVIVMRSKVTRQYLTMTKRGRLKGVNNCSSPYCRFHERIIQAGGSYYTYSINTRKTYFIAIGKSGRIRKGHKVDEGQKSAQFILRDV